MKSLLVLSVAALALVGCGNKEEAPVAAPTAATDGAPVPAAPSPNEAATTDAPVSK